MENYAVRIIQLPIMIVRACSCRKLEGEKALVPERIGNKLFD